MDTEYFLDAGAELGDFTPLEYMALCHAPQAYNAVRALVDADRRLPQDFCINTAAAYLAEAPPVERHVLALASLEHNAMGLKAFQERAEFLAETVGMQQIGLGTFLQPITLELFPELAAAVDVGPLAPSEITESWCRALVATSLAPHRSRWEAMLAAQRAALEWVQAGGAEEARDYQRKLEKPIFQPRCCGVAAGSDYGSSLETTHGGNWRRESKVMAKAKRSLEHRARSAIKKATKLMTSLGRAEQLRLLVSGSEVEVQHPDSPFKFILKARSQPGWLIERTANPGYSSPVHVLLLTKDNVRITSVCVYFYDTPAVDYLLAFSMLVEAGHELELLEKGNWFGIEECDEQVAELIASRYPTLAKKLPRSRGEAPLTRMGDLVARFENQWSPYRGPVSQWVKAWLTPVATSIEDLRAIAQPGQLQLPDFVRRLLVV